MAEKGRSIRKAARESHAAAKNPPLISPATSRKRKCGGAAKGGVTKVFKATGAAEARPLQQGKHRVKAQSNSVKIRGVERAEQNQQAALLVRPKSECYGAG